MRFPLTPICSAQVSCKGSVEDGLASSGRVPIPRGHRSRRMPLSRTMGIAFFCIGLILPLVSTEAEREFRVPTFAERIVPVDLLVLGLMSVLLLRGKLRLPLCAKVYVGALLFSFAIGMVLVDPTTEKVYVPAVGFAALSMAFFYMVLGHNLRGSPNLSKATVLGVAVGAMWQLVIVAHDSLFSWSQWFLEPMAGRVRGTFRASGQLGAYGFSAAGILLTFGWAFFRSYRLRSLLLLAGLFSVYFTVAASRRSAVIAIICWAVLFLILGYRHLTSLAYVIVLVCVVVGGILLHLHVGEVKETFHGRRVSEALDSLQTSVDTGDTRQVKELRYTLRNVGMWFPIGAGTGRSRYVGWGSETHNGHLAVVTELGVVGLLAFYAMLYHVASRRFTCFSKQKQGLVVRALVMAFVLAAAIFMGHNRLHRDRTFMLFLGLASNPFLAAGRGVRAYTVHRFRQMKAAASTRQPLTRTHETGSR